MKYLPSVYDYTDYRLYLQDYYSAKCRSNRTYSHRAMARELGFPSPNFLKLVMDGKRNVGLRSIDRLMNGLGLDDREQHYFSSLVFFCQAKTVAKKNYHLGVMSSLKVPYAASTVTESEYRYYNEWYHCIVRELIVREPAPVDFGKIAKKIRPHVTATQVKKSVTLLRELGFICEREDGTFSQASRILVTDREVKAVGIRNYHAKMMEFAAESMDSVPREKREISSLTLSISEECMSKIKKRIQEFEDEILQMAHEDHDVNRVYQLGIQFFPMTQEE